MAQYSLVDNIDAQAEWQWIDDHRHKGIWKFSRWLPIQRENDPLLTGNTPLVSAPRLAEYLEVRRVSLKIEAAAPSGSFKDRVVALAAARAHQLGHTHLLCASTGNLAGAVAARAAAEGWKATVAVPKATEYGKWAQADALGAQVLLMPSSYDRVNALIQMVGDECDIPTVNASLRPWYGEGSKTLAWEILTDTHHDEDYPDHIITPIASGSLYSQIARACFIWKEGGMIEKSPRVHGAQASGCAPLTDAWRAGEQQVRRVRANTLAASLAIGIPTDGHLALKWANQCEGTFHTVDEDALVEHGERFASLSGILTEPAGWVAFGGAIQAAQEKIFEPNDHVTIVISGSGLKTVGVHGQQRSLEISADFDVLLNEVQ